MSETRLIDGTPRVVVDLPFEIIKEPWLEYELADGGRARVRCVTTAILKVVDENGQDMANPLNGQKPWLILETNTTIGRLVT